MNYQQWHKPGYEHTPQISISICDIWIERDALRQSSLRHAINPRQWGEQGQLKMEVTNKNSRIVLTVHLTQPLFP